MTFLWKCLINDGVCQSVSKMPETPRLLTHHFLYIDCGVALDHRQIIITIQYGRNIKNMVLIILDY